MSPKNLPASIRQRLLNLSRQQNLPFNQLLQYYAMERFLYRFSKSQYADRFILKGALLMQVWHAPGNRSTKDIDMLGNTSNSESHIKDVIHEILFINVEPDDLEFRPDTITTESIAEDADYTGIRICFFGYLDTARMTMQIDIGFCDPVYPQPKKETYPTILDLPAPELLCYSR